MGRVERNRYFYLLDGRETPLFSGTLQYWRVPADRWKERLRDVIDAGCNAVETYIPWNWHEYEEGFFDFTGETDPRRDLEGFLDIVGGLGLYAVVRPGPYICGEWVNGGIPDWLIDGHPEILARTAEGKPLPRECYYPPITYLHPTYLSYVEKWYDAVIPRIVKRLYTRGEFIVSVTLDDEPSYWELIFHPLLGDYSSYMVGRNGEPGLYHQWLEEVYEGDIGRVNRRYSSSYRDFPEVEPPRAPPKRLKDIPRMIDWHEFKLHTVNLYVERLYRMVKDRGVDVPISILDPYLLIAGWNRFLEFCRRRGLEIDLWTEFWYFFWRSFSFKEDQVGHLAFKTAVYRRLTGKAGSPTFSIETQAFLGYHMERDEAELLYRLLPALGFNNINFYTMVGAENPRGYGCHNGRSYDVSCPIGLDGSKRPHYYAIKSLSQIFKVHGSRIGYADFKADVALGFYEPYEACVFLGDTSRYGLEYSVRRALMENLLGSSGLLNLLFMSEVKFDVLDLESEPLEELRRYRQLWVYALDFLSKSIQEKLVRFIEDGGRLVILPTVPYLDEDMEPHLLLREKLKFDQRNSFREGENSRLIPYSKVDFPGEWDMVVRGYVRRFKVGEDCTPIAWDSSTGEPAAYRVKCGEGYATVVGFNLLYMPSFHEQHRKFVRYLLRLDGVRIIPESSCWDLQVLERRGRGYSYLFLVNPVGYPLEGKIRFEDPSRGDVREIPSLLGKIGIPRRGVQIAVSNLTLDGETSIVYATSTPIAWSVKDGCVHIEFQGQPGSICEAAFKLQGKPVSVDLEGGELLDSKWDNREKVFYTGYEHTRERLKMDITV